jgi:hypothetical protein
MHLLYGLVTPHGLHFLFSTPTHALPALIERVSLNAPANDRGMVWFACPVFASSKWGRRGIV